MKSPRYGTAPAEAGLVTVDTLLAMTGCGGVTGPVTEPIFGERMHQPDG